MYLYTAFWCVLHGFIHFCSVKWIFSGNSLTVQWLRHCASTAGGIGSIPGQWTKIPHAVGHGQKRHNILKQPNQEPLNDTYAA